MAADDRTLLALLVRLEQLLNEVLKPGTTTVQLLAVVAGEGRGKRSRGRNSRASKAATPETVLGRLRLRSWPPVFSSEGEKGSRLRGLALRQNSG